MADIAKTIEIIFSGVDNVSATTQTIGREIESVGGSIGDIATPLADAAKAVLAFEAALATLAAAGLVVAFNKSKEFENSVIELKKVLGEGQSTDAAVAAAKELSDVYGESATNILESTANFKQAGFDIEGAMTLAANALDLVIAGGLSAEDASNLLTATIKGFKAEAGDAARVIDVLNETSNNYSTNVQQLAEGMARVSPIAQQMGFTIEETAGLLTPIIEVFRSGDEAANALRTGLLKLTDDSKPVQDALKTLGVSQTDLNGNLRSGKDIFYDVATAMGNLDGAQRSFLTQQLVGIEQAPKMSLLFSDLSKVLDITETAMGSAGSAAGEVAQRLESSQVSIDRFKVGFENLAVSVGDGFRNSAKGAIDGVTDIENSLRKLVDNGAFDPLLNYVSDIADNIGEAVSDIAANLPEAFEDIDFNILIDGLNNLKDSFSELFDGVDITTPEGLTTVIQGVVDTLAGLQNIAAGIIDFLVPIRNVINELVPAFSELSPEVQNTVGKFLGLGTALTALAGVLATGGALVAGIGALGLTLTGPVGIVAGITALTAGVFAAVDALSKLASNKWNEDLREETRALEKQNEQIEILLNQLKRLPLDANTVDIELAIEKGQFEEAQALIDKAVAKEYEIKTKLLMEQEEFENTYAKLQTLGSLSEQEIKIIAKADGVDEIEEAITEITKNRVLNVEAKADLEPVTQEIEVWSEENGTITIEVPVDTTEIKEAEKEVEKIPTEKELEIKLQGEIDTQIAQIEASAQLAQSAFEWTAKVDIAEAEAAASVAKSAFDSIGTSVQSVTESVGDMFGSLVSGLTSGKLSNLEESNLFRYLNAEQEAQDKLIESQVKLTEAEVKYLNAKAKSLESGDANITISSNGLEPALEMVMWEIIKKVQIRATEESADFLLGIG